MMNLEEVLKPYSVQITPEIADSFERYYRLLTEWNEKVNLTAITEHDEVYIKHFADSVLPAAQIKKGATLCDVGTGAGFPGIPLKIVRNDLKITLLDSLNKRVLFLEEVCRALGLEAECLHLRAEDAGQGALREKFDVVTSRAVARLNTLCEYTLPLVKVGGVFIAYKASCDEELAEAEKAVHMLGGKVHNTVEIELCGQHRTLIFIEKVSPTPKKFPRGKGKEKSCPIL